jgi:hippurate hydrolase
LCYKKEIREKNKNKLKNMNKLQAIRKESLQPFYQMMVDFRHDLHRNPESGFNEVYTAKQVSDALKSLGLEVHENLGQTGVIGVLRCGSSSASIMLRADMDALPIDEKSTHDYCSTKPNMMHACGHDGHSAMLLGAAAFLSQDQYFDGTVYFLFQPNEECGLGALAMLDDNVLEKFPADEIYAIHNLPGAPLGEFSTRYGNICASESLFEISIQGQGGHAAMPQAGVDALIVGAEIILSLQTIIARKLTPGAGAVVSVTEFVTDGARNILPGNGIIKGDVRARTPEDREIIRQAMARIVNGIADAHNVTATFSFNTEFIETINHASCADAAMLAASNLGYAVVPDREPMSFSEDFAHFAAANPACFILMGNGTEGVNARPLHSNDYDFSDDALVLGAAFWARLASERLPL